MVANGGKMGNLRASRSLPNRSQMAQLGKVNKLLPGGTHFIDSSH